MPCPEFHGLVLGLPVAPPDDGPMQTASVGDTPAMHAMRERLRAKMANCPACSEEDADLIHGESALRDWLRSHGVSDAEIAALEVER